MSYGGLVCFSAVLSVAICFLPACRETQKEQYERQLREAPGPMRHAVHSDRLLKLMAELRHLTYSRLPQELEQGAVTEARIEEIRWIASGMSSAAELIPNILDDVELGPEQRAEFRLLAEDLARKCRTFEAVTATLSTDRARSADGLVAEFSEVLDTCDACHSRFRVLSQIRKD